MNTPAKVEFDSAAYRLRVAREGSDKAWSLTFEDLIAGDGPGTLQAPSKLSLADASYMGVRQLLPPVMFLPGAIQSLEGEWIFAELACLTDLEWSRQEVTQFVIGDSCNELHRALLRSHVHFATGLVDRCLGRRYHARLIDASLATADSDTRSKRLAEELLGVVHQGGREKSTLSGTEDAAVFVRASIRITQRQGSSVDSLQGRINSSYRSADYAERRTSSFLEHYLRNPIGDTVERIVDECSPYWCNEERLLDRLNTEIQDPKGFSLVRIGEGEGCFSAYAEYMSDNTRRNEALGIIGKNIYEVWFKESIRDLEPGLYRHLMDLYRDTIRTASVLGIPSVPRVIFEYGQFYREMIQAGHSRPYLGVVRALDDVLAERASRLTPFAFVDCDVARPLYAWQRPSSTLAAVLPRALHGVKRLTLITCHKDLETILHRQLKISSINTIIIPPEKGRISGEGYIKSSHLHEHFPSLLKRCETMGGEVVIVAAGFLGKIYCAAIHKSGGTAIDVGSLADFWVGRNTRSQSQRQCPSPFVAA